MLIKIVNKIRIVTKELLVLSDQSNSAMVKNIEQMKTFKTISNIVKENDLHRLEADCYGLLVFNTNNEAHPEMDGSKYQGHITRCGKKQGHFLGVRCHNTGTMIAPLQKVHFNFKVKDIKRFEIEI